MAPISGQPASEDGQVVGAYVLVRQERAHDDEQVWLARTSRLPPAPMTARLRGKPGRGKPSPFGTEIQLGTHLQHPNLDVATEEHALGPWVCAISADAPGVPLPELLPAFVSLRAQDEPRWAVGVAHVVASLLNALAHAHGATGAPGHPKGIVHGAVRPGMITIGAAGNVRLGGFGATFEEDPSRIVDRPAEAMTYAPPEGFGLRAREFSLDVWGVGTVLHELLDGTRFRGGITDTRVLYRAAIAGDVAPPGRAAPEPLERLRQWLLAKQAWDRPRSCAEALAALPGAGDGAAILTALVQSQRSGGAAPAVGPSMFDAFAASHSMPPQVRAPQPLPSSLPSMPPVSLPYSPPAASPPSQAYGAPSASPPYSPPASPPYSPPASPPCSPPAAVAPPPAFVPPAAMRMPLPDDEGTVQIDAAMLAAMRAGTEPPASAAQAPVPAQPGYPQPGYPQPGGHPQPGYPQPGGHPHPQPGHPQFGGAPEPVMLPPAGRSSGRSAPPPSRAAEPSMLQPATHQPGGGPPQGSYPPPSAAPPPGSYRPHPSYPASSHPPAAAPSARSRPDPHPGAPPSVRHDPGPLDFQPTYEPTTMTVTHARRSTRNFALILVVAAVVAVAVGIGVGYLIVGDEPVAAPSKAAPRDDAPREEAPAKRSGSPAAPSGEGPVLQPRAP